VPWPCRVAWRCWDGRGASPARAESRAACTAAAKKTNGATRTARNLVRWRLCGRCTCSGTFITPDRLSGRASPAPARAFGNSGLRRGPRDSGHDLRGPAPRSRERSCRLAPTRTSPNLTEPPEPPARPVRPWWNFRCRPPPREACVIGAGAAGAVVDTSPKPHSMRSLRMRESPN
jgi:hypothetical protein